MKRADGSTELAKKSIIYKVCAKASGPFTLSSVSGTTGADFLIDSHLLFDALMLKEMN